MNARWSLTAVAFAVASACLARPAGAQFFPPPTPSPAPSASPSASPAPTPRPGTVSVAADATITFISQNTSGFGQLGLPEGPAFIAGASPAAPLTPYDTFSSAPMTPGDVGETALYFTPTYFGSAFDASVTFGVGYVTGSTTNATYWGESLIPPLNPHLGSQSVGVRRNVSDGSRARRRQCVRRIGAERFDRNQRRPPAPARRLVQPRAKR